MGGNRRYFHETTWRNLSDDDLYRIHWYKELMGPEERRDRYQVLRMAGMTPSQARRWRDVSGPNYDKVLALFIAGQERQASSQVP